MDFKTINPDKSISLFVKNILVFEGEEKENETILPFFADGYPGLLFQQTENGLFVQPHNKKMPLLFLYGQTIKPIELHLKGRYTLIVFQLYPFVLKSFFRLSAKDINDGCYDLQGAEEGGEAVEQLLQSQRLDERIEIIAGFLLRLFKSQKDKLDLIIKQALLLIIESKGQISVRQVCQSLPVTERTFERRFLTEVGVSAKAFSQMIRFQQSLAQLTLKEFTRLTDVVYANGFADQSHFIRVFKVFTGQTPSDFLKKKA